MQNVSIGIVDASCSYILPVFNTEFQLLEQAKSIWSSAIAFFWKLSKVSYFTEKHNV